MPYLILFILSFSMAKTDFTSSQCQTYQITEGESGHGILRHCAQVNHQRLYVSGDIDVNDNNDADCEGNSNHRKRKTCRDYRSVLSFLKHFKKQKNGIFEIISENAGGGEVAWHQKLAMKVEDSCQKNCKRITRIKGACESACAQLHITCVKNAET